MTEDQFNEWLDEIYGTINIGGLEYSTSEALKAVDPIAYRVMMSDLESQEESEFLDKIEAEERRRFDYLGSLLEEA